MLDHPVHTAEQPRRSRAATRSRHRSTLPMWTRGRLALLVGGYVAGLGGMIAARGLFISADRYFVILLVPALALGLARPYVRDFLPFIVAILVYEECRGLAHTLRPLPFYAPMIDVDRFLFLGHLPSRLAQDWLWTGSLQWYDHAFALLQRAHFIVPPTLLFLIWLERRQLFYRCALTLVVVSFAGALTFLVLPAAPPWRASQVGRIEPLVKVGNVQGVTPVNSPGSFIQHQLLPNPYAAVPSLHTAYSLLVVVFAFAWRRRVGYALLGYPVLMWFTIVYFADHYVADIIVGAVYAIGAWLIVGRLLRGHGRIARLAGPFSPPLAAARLPGGSPQ